MSLAPGARLGPYEVTAKLGEGGMGEVYRATDTRLKREVALKVLPDLFTRDAERLARFEREAQLLAQLHHPRIASIFGIEESGDARALVMELVEGQTLGERLASGPLPAEEGLQIALEIAEALETAHEKGIVHRDLKPANVKLTPEGKVKVLDFGLAKALDPTGAGEPGSAALEASPTMMNSPTLTAMGTQLGVILGTAAYMSPEQARGKPVDKRADIWAFGVVLYEMLATRRLFAADSVPDTLAGVLKTEIDFGKLPASTPPGIRRLLRRCLDRNPKNRLRDIGDARLEIEDALGGAVDETAPAIAPTAATPTWLRALPWVAAAALAIALIAALSHREPEPQPVHSDIAPPAERTFVFQGDAGSPAVLSADGRTLVFGARGSETGTPSMLWVRSLSSGEQREIPGTEGAFAPFLSPDGKSVGFFSDGALRVAAIQAGQPLRLADAPNGRGGAWAPDGTIIFSPDFRAPLWRIPATGGRPEQITTVDPERHSTHRWPVLTPDGRAVLFLATHHAPQLKSSAGVRYVRLDGSDEHEVLAAETNVAVAGGHLLFLREGTLFAQPFDSGNGTLSGAPAPVAQGVLYDPSTWRGTFSASDRYLVTGTGITSGNTRLSWFDRSGRVLEELTEQAFWGDLRLSPDGRTLAASRANRNLADDIWLLDLERGTESRLTFEEVAEFSPVWSPDGRWLYYLAGDDAPDGSGPDRILRKRASGTGSPEVVYEGSGEYDVYPADASPDGRRLLVLVGTFPYERDSDLAWLELDGSGAIRRLLETPGAEGEARISPDGKFIAYSAAEVSGIGDVYVMALGEDGMPEARWEVTRETGRWPVFTADGSEIIYNDANGSVLSVAITRGEGAALRFSTPQPLFSVAALPDRNARDVAPDGRILVNHFGIEQTLPLRLVENWQP